MNIGLGKRRRVGNRHGLKRASRTLGEVLERRQLFSAPADPVIASLSSAAFCQVDLTYENPDGSRLILEEQGPGDDSYHKLLDLTAQVGTFSTGWTVLMPGAEYSYRLRADRDGLVAATTASVTSDDGADAKPPGNHAQDPPVLTPYSGPGTEVGVNVAVSPDYRAAMAGRWADRPAFAGGPRWSNMGPAVPVLAPYSSGGSVRCEGPAGWNYDFRAYTDGIPPYTSDTSLWSTPVQVTIPGGGGGASGVSVTRTGDNALSLNWNAPVYPTPSTSYLVGGNYHAAIDQKVMYTNHYTFSGLSPGRWHFKAYVAGQGLAPDEASMDVITAPSDFRAYLGSAKDQVRLIWDDPNPVETGFKVERQDPLTLAWTEVATLPAGAASCEDTLPADYAGKTYPYRIFTLGAGGLISAAVTTTGSGIALRSVPFGGPGSMTVNRDDSSGPYTGRPQWLDDNMNGKVADEVLYTSTGSLAKLFANGTKEGYRTTTPSLSGWENTLPLSYVRSTTGAPSKIAASPTCFYAGAIGTWLMQGSGGGQTFDPQATTTSGGWVWSDLVAHDSLPSTIQSQELEITWKLSTDGGTTWFEVGKSRNHLYVNGSWYANNEFETVVDIGCRRASTSPMSPGTYAENKAIADAIWLEFQGNTVKRVDGTELKYWDGGAATAVDTAGLLHDGNGQCGAWAELLRDTLIAQGVAQARKVEIRSAYGSSSVMLVKSWTFVGAGTAPPVAGAFRWQAGEYADQNGVAGKGNPNPPGGFYNHFIVEICERDAAGVWVRGAYYDPSYGGSSYEGATQQEARENWENASLDGFTQRIVVTDGAGNFWYETYAKKNDPGLETVFS